MSLNKTHQKTRSEQGFSLLEVMIALLILSIGMLGIAGLQAAAIRHNDDAKIRTQASMNMNNIINRMQAKIKLEVRKQTKTQQEVITEYATTAAAGNCDAFLSTIANDITCFNAEIDNLFPGASVSFTDSGDRVLNINVKWYNRDLNREVDTDWSIRL